VGIIGAGKIGVAVALGHRFASLSPYACYPPSDRPPRGRTDEAGCNAHQHRPRRAGRHQRAHQGS
jgi:hypothetical protein